MNKNSGADLSVKENHFYRMVIKSFDDKSHDCVVKCTRIQNFKKTAGYTVYHFKYFGGEIVVTDQDKYHVESFYNQGYVWIKTENGFITKDDVPNTFGLHTIWYKILLVQKDYGKTWALTKEELENEKNE